VLGILTTSTWALQTARRTADSFARDARDADPNVDAPTPEAELAVH
jgi:hypothetical protein